MFEIMSYTIIGILAIASSIIELTIGFLFIVWIHKLDEKHPEIIFVMFALMILPIAYEIGKDIMMI